MKRHRKPSPATVAWKTGSAAALFCSGAFFLTCRLFFDVAEHVHGQPLEGPGAYYSGMLFLVLALPFLPLVTLTFTFHVCWTRCDTLALRWITALGALLAMSTPIVLEISFRELGFLCLYPALLLFWVTSSWAGLYLGSVIQIFLAAWLLGWLDRSSRKGRVVSSRGTAAKS